MEYLVIGNETVRSTQDQLHDNSSCLVYYSISEFALEIAKMLRLLKNEKTLLLTNEDMFTKISLIFSRIQKEKLGDGELQVSDVLDAFNKIKSATMAHDKENDSMQSSIMDEIPQIVAKEYLFDLKSQNLIDPLALFNKLHSSFNCNDKTDSVS